VHPALARQLAVKDERFEAEWRRARRFDLVWHYRSAVVTIGLITMGSVLAAAVGLHDTARKIGWLLAVLVFVVGGIAVLAKARQDWNALKP
jgi:hypothetical protein